MSRPVLASETAALGLADEAYGQMVTLDDPGGAAALEPELARMYDALQGQTIPAMATDVAHGIRSLRNGAFEILGDVMEGLADDRAVDVLRLAEANVRARLVQQAQETINQRNRGAGLAWTRYLGNRMGAAVRNVVGLVNEGATGRVFWGEGSYENRRVETEVQAQIAARFAGRNYDTLDPADQEMVRQEVGRLAPNIMAFQPRELLEWARINASAAPNPNPPPPNLTYYQLVSGILGEEEIGSRYAIPILSILQKNPAYRAHLEAIYQARVDTPPVQTAYNAERQRRSDEEGRMKTFNERILKIKAALEELSQIREQETTRRRNQEEANRINTRLANAAGVARGAPGFIEPSVEKSLQDSLREYNRVASTAAASLGRLITRFKGNYRREMLLIFGPALTTGNYNTLFATDPTSGELLPPALQNRSPEDVMEALNEILDVDAGGLGMTAAEAAAMEPPVAVPMGLSDQHDQVKERVDRRDEDYSPTHRPDLAREGYKNFADLKEKASQSVSSRSGATLTSHQLLYELLYRQTRVEIPPTGVVPPAGTRNLPLEEAQLRATIATLMLMDRVDSSMDEGFAVRQASNLARNRVIRFAERNARITFNEFVTDNLAQQEAFKELGGLTLETTANDILNLLNTEKIKIENLPELMRQIELLGQDQLAGEGNLEFGVDVRPLLYQIQLAWYRRKAEALVDKVNEPGVENKAETLLNMLKEEAPKAIPAQVTPGSQPLSLETRKESRLRKALDALRGKLEGVAPESDEAKVVNRQMGILQTLGTEFGTELVAELLANAMVKIPKWFAKKGALAAEATAEVAGEAVEQAAENSDALNRLRQRTAARAAQVTRRAA